MKNGSQHQSLHQRLREIDHDFNELRNEIESALASCDYSQLPVEIGSIIEYHMSWRGRREVHMLVESIDISLFWGRICWIIRGRYFKSDESLSNEELTYNSSFVDDQLGIKVIQRNCGMLNENHRLLHSTTRSRRLGRPDL